MIESTLARIMVQSHKLALPAAVGLLLLATVCGATSDLSTGTDLLTGYSKPMLSSLAHQFFSLAADQPTTRNDTEDALCNRDVARIRAAITNMEEWALECKLLPFRFMTWFPCWVFPILFFLFCCCSWILCGLILWPSVNQFQIKSDKSCARS